MSGQDLYELYIEANAADDIGVNSWEDISEGDKSMWCRIAAQVRMIMS